MKIKCPYCGKILEVKSKTDEKINLATTLACPLCKSKFSLSECEIVKEVKEEVKEEGGKQKPGSGEQTNVNLGNYKKGELKVLNSNLPNFKLKEGSNVVGRKAQTSQADIQIPAEIPAGQEKHRFSREQIVINVIETPKGYVHKMSLYKSKVNATYYNNVELQYGNSYILKDNDIIKFPDNITVKFVMPDSEGTEID